jgi:hypothetical protein
MANPNVMTAEDEDAAELQGNPLDILNEGVQPSQRPARPDANIPEYEIVVEGDEEPSGNDNANQLRPDADDGQGNDQGEDEHYVDPNETAEERSQRVREPRWSKNRRRAAARDRDKRDLARATNELARLREQMANMERRFGAVEPRLDEMSEVNLRGQKDQLARRRDEAIQKFNTLEDQYYTAVEAGDTARMREVGRLRDQAAEDKFRLGVAVEEFDRQVEGRRAAPARQPQNSDQRQQPQAAQQQVDPLVSRMASDFIKSDAPWYNTPGAEDDTAVMNALEQRVAQSGLDPATDEFWDELADRAAKVLPHRFQEPTAAPARQAAPRGGAQRPAAQAPIRRGPPTGAPGARSTATSPNQIKLSPQRLEAARLAGYLGDDNRPIDKAKFYKVAQEWAAEDRANQRAGR